MIDLFILMAERIRLLVLGPLLVGALVVAGATGTLGNEVLRRLLGTQRFGVAHVLAREAFTDGLRSVNTVVLPGTDVAAWPPVPAEAGVVMFDPPRLFYDRERALEIMKDSRLGSYGALGLMLTLLLKAVVLALLATPLFNELDSAESSHVRQVLLAWTMMALIWCHAASRLVPVCLIRFLPYAGDLDHAKAKPLAMQVSWLNLLGAVLMTCVVASLMWCWFSFTAWPAGTLLAALMKSTLAMAVGAVVCARWFSKRLGGFTGDTLGASQQLAELAILLAWLHVVHPING